MVHLPYKKAVSTEEVAYYNQHIDIKGFALQPELSSVLLLEKINQLFLNNQSQPFSHAFVHIPICVQENKIVFILNG